MCRCRTDHHLHCLTREVRWTYCYRLITVWYVDGFFDRSIVYFSSADLLSSPLRDFDIRALYVGACESRSFDCGGDGRCSGAHEWVNDQFTGPSQCSYKASRLSITRNRRLYSSTNGLAVPAPLISGARTAGGTEETRCISSGCPS